MQGLNPPGLTCTITGAKFTKSMATFGSMSPYCIVEVDGKEIFRSDPVAGGGLTPQFENINLEIPTHWEGRAKIAVWTARSWPRTHGFCGDCEFPTLAFAWRRLLNLPGLNTLDADFILSKRGSMTGAVSCMFTTVRDWNETAPGFMIGPDRSMLPDWANGCLAAGAFGHLCAAWMGTSAAAKIPHNGWQSANILLDELDNRCLVEVGSGVTDLQLMRCMVEAQRALHLKESFLLLMPFWFEAETNLQVVLNTVKEFDVHVDSISSVRMLRRFIRDNHSDGVANLLPSMDKNVSLKEILTGDTGHAFNARQLFSLLIPAEAEKISWVAELRKIQKAALRNEISQLITSSENFDLERLQEPDCAHSWTVLPNEVQNATAKVLALRAINNNDLQAATIMYTLCAGKIRYQHLGLDDTQKALVENIIFKIAIEGKAWEMQLSGDSTSKDWETLPDQFALLAEAVYAQYLNKGKKKRRTELVVAEQKRKYVMDLELMTAVYEDLNDPNEKSRVLPLRRMVEGKQTYPPPDQPHPWYNKRVSLHDDATDFLTNDFFFRAFTKIMEQNGHKVNAEPHEIFDFRYNQDYRENTKRDSTSTRTSQDSGQRGGLVYREPKGWKRFAARVKGKYDDGDNTWMNMDVNDGGWAVAYHGTKFSCINGILSGGLRAGGGQAHKDGKDVRTGEVIGTGIYCTPDYDGIARSYAGAGFEFEGLTILFVMQCRVRPSAIKRCHDEDTTTGAYWVIRDPIDIRPYGVLVTKKA